MTQSIFDYVAYSMTKLATQVYFANFLKIFNSIYVYYRAPGSLPGWEQILLIYQKISRGVTASRPNM